MSLSKLLLFFLLIPIVVSQVHADDEPLKYALLIAVTKYDHAEMNGRDPLQFPEEDAKAIGQLLKDSGYQVDFLLGKQATKSNIEQKLKGLKSKANAPGICLVGMFGHGIEVSRKEKDGSNSIIGCFCPFDTGIQEVQDANGKVLFNGNSPMIEPDPTTLLTLEQVINSLKVAKAGSRVVIADCCREIPNRARGRNLGLGASFKVADLPTGTVVLFGCKPGEQALERDDWGHGAFTKSLLEEMSRLSQDRAVTTGALADAVKANVQRLTGRKQNPTPFAVESIDLLLKSRGKPESPQPTSLGSELTNSIGIKLKLIPAGMFKMGSTETKNDLERMGLSLGENFNNADEFPQHTVEISKPFYMGVHEVTLEQFLVYYNADKSNHKTEGEKDGKGGWGYDGIDFKQKPEYTPWNTGWNKPVEQYMNHPVVNVSWNDAVGFCEWLTERERKLGRIRNDQEYTLPTEAQWEYACRGGSRLSKLFSFGNDSQQFPRHGNIQDAAYLRRLTANKKFGDPVKGDDGYVFASPVGSYQANGYGLHDMHGNVWEWCLDVYDAKSYSKRGASTKDPIVVSGGSNRVFRGGSWDTPARLCRSALRDGDSPDYRVSDLGFRISLVPADK